MKKFKYFLFLIASIFLLSCENENSKIEQDNLSRKKIPSHIKSSNISKEEINSNPLLSSKLSFLENKKASMMNSREVYNATYSFTTHTNKALHIQDTNSGYESYTFLITRANASNSSNLENLQLSIYPDGTTEAYIVSYNFTQEEYKTFTREDLHNSEKKLTKININSDELIEDKTVLVITDYGGYICVEEWYVGDYCCGPEGDLLIYSNCTYTGGGGTAGDNDNSDGSGGTLSSGDGVNNGNGGGGSGGTGTIGDDYLGDSCRGCGWTAPVTFDDLICNYIDSSNDSYSCECELNGSEREWTNDLENIEEPKWGQLANKQQILDEINSITGLSNMSYHEQITALANHFEKNLMYDINDNNLPYIIDPSKDVNRYLYSEIAGWIDFHHVFKIFQWATENGPFNAIALGEMGEMWQSLKDNNSAYSYEDLPSNYLGVALYIRFSQSIASGDISWHDVIETALNELNCIEPEEAPNFNYIPYIVNEYYPKNYTYTPLLGEELKNYHKQKFCERPIYEQERTKQVHELFNR